MEYGICLQSVVPVRSEPLHASEMVTQILFGELYQVTAQKDSWARVVLLFDAYEGWVDLLQVHLIPEEEYLRLAGSETSVTLDLVQLVSHETGKSMMPVVMGSSLPAYSESRIRVGSDIFFYEGSVSGHVLPDKMANLQNILKTREQLLEDAMLYLNAPYLWGGRSPFGIDCSGFVQMVFKLQGLKLLRDASQQATQGEVISLPGEAEPGDLAFFDDAGGNITHVGLLADRHRIIHCSGQVRIDAFDHEGIYNMKLQRYTHKLRLIKRII